MLLRLRKIERQPSSREDKHGHRRLKNRERSGCRGLEAEQREARLQRMSANQSDRLAAETQKNRERPECRGCASLILREWL